MKKVFFSFFFFFDTSVKKLLTSDFSISQVTSVDKREPWGTFLSPGLFISRPQPQKCGLGFEKLSLGSLLSTSVTWEKLKSEVKTVSYRRVIEKKQNKILLYLLPEMATIEKNIQFTAKWFFTRHYSYFAN